jgi:hypothetical protein
MHAFVCTVELGGQPFQAFVVELLPERNLRELFEQLYRSKAQELALADVLVIRPTVKWQLPKSLKKEVKKLASEDPQRSAFLEDVAAGSVASFSRVTTTPVHILSSDNFVHFISGNINANANFSHFSGSAGAEADFLEAIKLAEIEHIVESGRAHLPSNPGILYKAPSSRAMRTFMRVGNIQRSRAAIDGLFFWLLPWLKSCVGIITDTWSIASIALNASRRLRDYAGPMALNVPVEMLSKYHDGSTVALAEAAEIVDRFAFGQERTSDGKVLFLISATHSGSLSIALKKFLSERGANNELVDFVALFKLGATPNDVHSLCDYSDSRQAEFGEVADEEVRQSEIIEIDPYVYFPLQYKEIVYTVRKDNVVPIRSFIDKYGDNLFYVHKQTETRHHGVWIDTECLAQMKTFQDELADRVRKLVPVPQLIITPLHTAACEMAAVAARAIKELNGTCEVLTHETLLIESPPTEQDQKVLNAIEGIADDGAILFLDDVFITGRRLTSYQKHLRNFNFSGFVHYLVAVARPDQLTIWSERCRMLRYRSKSANDPVGASNTCDSIEQFVLPNWEDYECPWCKEIEIYQQLLHVKGDEFSSHVLKTRLELLQTTVSDGLQNEIFLRCHPGEFYLTKDSIFAPTKVSDATVFAAVSSAVQSLRDKAKSIAEGKIPLGPPRYPLVTRLDDMEFLEHIFTDSILRASFLRAADAYELSSPSKEGRERMVGRAVSLIEDRKVTSRDLIGELILATIQNKIEQLVINGDCIDTHNKDVLFEIEPLCAEIKIINKHTNSEKKKLIGAIWFIKEIVDKIRNR